MNHRSIIKHKFKVIETPFFLTVSECKKAVSFIKRSPKLERSQILSKESKNIISKKRTSNTVFCNKGDNALIDIIDESMTSYMFRELNVMNPTSFAQLTEYKQGQYFKAHTDSMEYEQLLSSGMRQRIWTCLIYLNEPLEGGKTYFPNADITIEPEIGKIVAWRNTIPGTRLPLEQSEHLSEPVTKGEKYVVVKLFYESLRDIVNDNMSRRNLNH